MHTQLYMNGGFALQIEISYLPKTSISPIPDAGGHFPFAIEGDCSIFLDTVPINSEFEEFYPGWMQSLNAFPIYSIIQVHDYTEEDIVNECTQHNVSYSFMGSKKYRLIKMTINTTEQFAALFSYIQGSGNMNDLSMWSLHEDVFSLSKRSVKGFFKNTETDVMVINLTTSSSVFWVGYDGDWITLLTNNLKFETEEDVEKTFPEGFSTELIEYEDE